MTGGLLALVYAFTKAAPAGYEDSAHWTDPSTAGMVRPGDRVADGLLRHRDAFEAPTAAAARVIRNSNRAGAYISSLMVGAGMFAMFLFLGIFMQTILGYSPVQAGLAFLPFSVGIILGAGVASNLLPRWGRAR